MHEYNFRAFIISPLKTPQPPSSYFLDMTHLTTLQTLKTLFVSTLLLLAPQTTSAVVFRNNTTTSPSSSQDTMTKASGSPHYMTKYSKTDSGPLGLKDYKLQPFSSAAVPKSLWGSRYSLGDTIYVHAMRGRKMPNGKRHNGYLKLVDECIGGGCFQRGRPVIDIYVGTCESYIPDFTPTTVLKKRGHVDSYGC